MPVSKHKPLNGRERRDAWLRLYAGALAAEERTQGVTHVSQIASSAARVADYALDELEARCAVDGYSACVFVTPNDAHKTRG